MCSGVRRQTSATTTGIIAKMNQPMAFTPSGSDSPTCAAPIGITSTVIAPITPAAASMPKMRERWWYSVARVAAQAEWPRPRIELPR